jgi:hypothetical protein
MAYLYGELGRQERRPLKAHLASCAECRQAVAAWRTTMGQLDAWRLDGPHAGAPYVLRTLARAAAAALILAAGFGIGLLARKPGPDLESLRKELEPSIRQRVQEEFAAQWQASWPAAQAELQGHIGQQVQESLAQAQAYVLAASVAASRRSLADYARSLEATRAADHQVIFGTLTVLEQRRLAGEAALASDLETLATATGDGLARTRQAVAAALAWHSSGPVETVPSEVSPSEGRSVQ